MPRPMVVRSLCWMLASTLLFAACTSRPTAVVTRTANNAAAPASPASADAAQPVGETAPAEDHPTTADDEEANSEEDEGALDDSFDVEPPPDAAVTPPHPLAGVSDAELERRLTADPRSLGSMSIGKPSGGLLFNGVAMPPGDDWTVVAPGQSYGTEESVHYLETAIRAVAARFPGSPKLQIGDISARSGGYLSPHLSHQAGRDADVGYYYLDGSAWYRRATAQNMDTARSWALVRALITRTDVEMILIDHSVQALLRAEAEHEGEDAEWLDSLFKGRAGLPPIIRHAPGHATHLHVRFFSPIAQETGRRLYAALLHRGMIHVGPAYAVYVAKKGDTLVKVAKRFGTTVPAIRRANGLKSNVIQARKSYRIPEKGKAPPSLTRGPIAIPPRRLPPPASGRSASQ